MQSHNPTPEAGSALAKFVVFVSLLDGGLFLVLHVVFVVVVKLRSVQLQYQKREEQNLEVFEREMTQRYPIPRIPRARLTHSTMEDARQQSHHSLSRNQSNHNNRVQYVNDGYDDSLDNSR